MIIAYFVPYFFDTLKACSLISRSWYTAAVPHLHRTFTLRESRYFAARNKLGPLSELHKLGLVPLTKELQVNQSGGERAWFLPQEFSRRDLRHFSAFSNVHTLILRNLDIFSFIPHLKRYFGHFSPTLRSIVLYGPQCTPQQLSHFLSLFSNLDDVELHNPLTFDPRPIKLIPFSAPAPGLRGRLVLSNFSQVETWTHLIASCGGLRFRYMDLHRAASSASVLLKVCAGTLETLRFDVSGKPFYVGLWTRADCEQDLISYRPVNLICRHSKTSDP